MIINEKTRKELACMQEETRIILNNNSLTDIQTENYVRNLERHRYIILNEIKIYNKNVEFEYEKIKTIDNEYKTEFTNNILKIYVPEVMLSYKNIKTHNHKRILLNIAETTKPYAGIFTNAVFIYIKIYDKILGWDVDNKYIKPIADGLVIANVISDDNITKMSYAVTGEYSDNPHTEIYVFDSEKLNQFLENYQF